MQTLILALFFLALAVAGALGTETRLLLFWPGAVLLGLTGLLATLKWRLRVLFPPSEICLLTVLLFGGYLAARAWFSPVAAFAREDLVMLAGCFVAYFLTATAAAHPRWRVWLLGLLIVLVLGNLAVGFIHLSGHWDFSLVPYFSRSAGAGRIGGFYANANHLAAFLSFVLFLSTAWLFLGRGGPGLKLLLGFLIVGMAVGVALTVSRGALVGLAGGMAVLGAVLLWLLWRTRRHLFWKLTIAGVVVLAAGGAVIWKASAEYLQGRMERSPLSEDVRFGIWEAALSQNAESPLVGAGARAFYDGSIRYRSPKLPVYAEEALFAHNEYLQLLADYGWIGAGLLAAVLLAHAGNGLRFLGWFLSQKYGKTGRLTSGNLALCVGSLAALAATAIHAAFEFHFHVPATALLGAVILGLLANPGFELPPDAAVSARLPGLKLAGKLALAIASLGLLAAAWLHAPGDYYFALSQIDQSRTDTAAQRRHLDQSIAADPSNPEAFYLRGLLRLENLNANDRTGNQPVLREAVADLEAAIALNPASYLHLLALADAYDAQGRYDEALATITQAIAMAPLHEEPRLALGMHWHRLGEFEKAELAYLWAGQSSAWNEEGTARWTDNYRLLLQHAVLMRGQPKR